MASSPVPALVVVIASVAFQALLFDEVLDSFPLPRIDVPADKDIPWYLGGAVTNFLGQLVVGAFDVVSATFEVVIWLMARLTWDIPGMPGWVRVMLVVPTLFAVLWPAAQLVRGSS